MSGHDAATASSVRPRIRVWASSLPAHANVPGILSTSSRMRKASEEVVPRGATCSRTSLESATITEGIAVWSQRNGRYLCSLVGEVAKMASVPRGLVAELRVTARARYCDGGTRAASQY